MAKTSLNLDENIAGALCYVLTWLTGIIFFLLEKENKFVRFHAMQSILTFIPIMVLGWIVGWVAAPSLTWGMGSYSYNPGIPALLYLSYLIWLVMLLLWLFLMFKAYKGEKFKLPIIGDIAEKHA